jgi:hypothetical protein
MRKLKPTELPHVLMKPRVGKEGKRFYCLYPSDGNIYDGIIDGIIGWGKTPAEACKEFDKKWFGGVKEGGK